MMAALWRLAWLLCTLIGAEAVRRGQHVSNPVEHQNDLEPSLPRLLQQLLSTPKDEFQLPKQDVATLTVMIEKDPNLSSAIKQQSLNHINSASSSATTKDTSLQSPISVPRKLNSKTITTELLEKGGKKTAKNKLPLDTNVNLMEASTQVLNEDENGEEDNYLIKLEKPPSEDVAPPITGDNCTDEKILIDRERISTLEKDIEGREEEKKQHVLWINQAKDAIKKVQKQINTTNDSIGLIERSIKNLQQEKITVLNKMRKDELSYSLEEAKQSLRKLQEQSRGTQQEKEELAQDKVLIQERIDKLNLSLQELQTAN